MADEKAAFFRTWFIACRPWSWPASIVPVIFGAALAVAAGGAAFRPGVFLLSLLAMVILHSGANILSDADDLDKGLDKVGQVTPVTGAVARGWLTPAQARRGAAVFLAVGAALGLAVAALAGPAVLCIGVAGVLVGFGYTVLKYNALGDLAVFANFGPLATAGAWAAQAGSVSAVPFAWGVPSGLIIIGILHANNWRDIPTDREGGIRTMAGLLGDAGSLAYYRLLLGLPFLYVAAGVALSRAGFGPALPWTMLAVFLCLPMALDRLKKAANRAAPAQPLDFVTLDGATAQLNMVFGLLMTAGLLAGRWL